MKFIRTFAWVFGISSLLLAVGFIFRLPSITNLWPWEDGRYSYLFIGSIFAAAGAAAVWVVWAGDMGVLAGGTLNISIISTTSACYFFLLAFRDHRSNLIVYGILALVMAIIAAGSFLSSRRIPITDPRPTPNFVRVSFRVFVAGLILAGCALVFRLPVFPWDLNPDSSIIFGFIFLGNASYFAYGLYLPRWHNAIGQLSGFLAYDLVLIVPFVLLMNSVKPNHMLGLVIYIIVLLYSGGLAIYYLFLNPQSRLGS